MYVLEFKKRIRLKKLDFYGCDVFMEGGYMKIAIPKWLHELICPYCVLDVVG